MRSTPLLLAVLPLLLPACGVGSRDMNTGDVPGADSDDGPSDDDPNDPGGMWDAGNGDPADCDDDVPEDHASRWPFHRHDARRTGFTSAVGNFSSPPTIRWKHGMGGLVEPSPVMMRLTGDDAGNDIVAGAYGGVFLAVDGSEAGPGVSPLWTYETGATVGGDNVEFVVGSAALGDLDGIGDTIEVVVPGSGPNVHALRADGTELWTFETTGQQNTWSSPVVADLDGDGANEVVAMTDAIYVLDGATGSLVWKAGQCMSRTPSSPAVADLDGDGDEDVLGCPGFFGDGGNAFDGSTGALMWASPVIGHREATPAIADVDADGEMEVVEGINAVGTVVLDAKTGALEWQAEFDWPAGCVTSSKRVMSSPAIGQLDDDPQFEIVEGSNDSCAAFDPSTLYVFDGLTGEREWTFSGTHGYIESSPMIGDVDPASPGNEILFGDHGSWLMLLDRDGDLRWQVQVPSSQCGECKVVASPAMVDVDGVPGAEIVVGTNAGSLLVLEAPPLADEPTPTPGDCAPDVP